MSYQYNNTVGGPYEPPEHKFWEPEDGCPDCGRELERIEDGYECDYCESVFDLDGFPVAAKDLEPVDEPEQ